VKVIEIFADRCVKYVFLLVISSNNVCILIAPLSAYCRFYRDRV